MKIKNTILFTSLLSSLFLASCKNSNNKSNPTTNKEVDKIENVDVEQNIVKLSYSSSSEIKNGDIQIEGKYSNNCLKQNNSDEVWKLGNGIYSVNNNLKLNKNALNCELLLNKIVFNNNEDQNIYEIDNLNFKILKEANTSNNITIRNVQNNKILNINFSFNFKDSTQKPTIQVYIFKVKNEAVEIVTTPPPPAPKPIEITKPIVPTPNNSEVTVNMKKLSVTKGVGTTYLYRGEVHITVKDGVLIHQYAFIKSDDIKKLTVSEIESANPIKFAPPVREFVITAEDFVRFAKPPQTYVSGENPGNKLKSELNKTWLVIKTGDDTYNIQNINF